MKKKHGAQHHSLYEVEINLPIAKEKRKLSTRTVHDAVEIPSKHGKYKNVMRQRIDNVTQPNKTISQKATTHKCLTKNIFSKSKQKFDNVEIYESGKPKPKPNVKRIETKI